MKTKLQLLKETIAYYWGNPDRKCVDANCYCVYSATATSEGCAIGRLIPADLAKEFDSRGPVSVESIFDELPPEIKTYGKTFLRRLQNCHDNGYFASKDRIGIRNIFEKLVDTTEIEFPEENALYYKRKKLTVVIGSYNSKNPAIYLKTTSGEMYDVCTSNLEYPLANDEVAIGNHNGENWSKILEDYGLIEPSHRSVHQGFVTFLIHKLK